MGDYYSVMFVMNVNSLINTNIDAMDCDDDHVPIIYHFDSSPVKETLDANDTSLKFVYSFLNWLVNKKKKVQTITDTNLPQVIFNSKTLPVSSIRLNQ